VFEALNLRMKYERERERERERESERANIILMFLKGIITNVNVC
jgi:hypothetical protein